MAVVIRLARHGRTHRPYFRVVAIDSRCHREGKAAEILGIYDPLLPEKNIQVEIERVHAWIRQGAQYSDAVRNLLQKEGYQVWPEGHLERKAAQRAKVRAARKERKKKDPKVFVAASRRAVRRHKATTKAARLAEERAKAPKQEEAAAPAEGESAS